MEVPLVVFRSFPRLIYPSRLLGHRIGHITFAFAIEVTKAPLRMVMEINSSRGPFPSPPLHRGGYRASFIYRGISEA